jgi:N-glycosylase/DNA lyase
MGLIKQIRLLENSDVKAKVNKRLKEFKLLGEKGGDREWFSELCFCILTANSKARTALQIQRELGISGFCEACAGDVKKCIMYYKHRFHNNKTKYIVEARKHTAIKKTVLALAKTGGPAHAREWLAETVKGLGYKEASHFMRNVGYTDLAILDRHILNLMKEEGLISERPKTLTKKRYLETEKLFQSLARKAGMSAAELDLYMWYMKGGEVLK